MRNIRYLAEIIGGKDLLLPVLRPSKHIHLLKETSRLKVGKWKVELNMALVLSRLPAAHREGAITYCTSLCHSPTELL